ncbi:universal stress protein [Macromonas nakdongensis]|jgi:nucleotide-binding universal stress UspA family protein|uniref:universal stress protein n=1 Tax=Macromonas nakdongensis TaxID=1843082 RepID=UPI000C346685|nr:universal stress protein [Macromonas nakdongensis]
MKLLIPVDGSSLSMRAVSHAIQLAVAGLRTELVLVNVQEPASVYELVTLHDTEALAQVAEAAGRDMLAPAIAMAQGAGVPHVDVLATGDVVTTLLEVQEAQGCQAIVMGSHGKGRVRSAWLGSVSQAMLERSPVPITFVKPVDTDAD